MMAAELGMPVRVENDANLGALAEIVWGAGRGCSDLAYVKVSSGVGAGLVLGGRLYRGSAGTAGELGHLTLDESGPICRCGNRGCLETFASAEAVLEPLRRTHGAGLALSEAIELASAGDVGCARSIADAGRALGVAIAGLCNLLAPQRVIVGGDLARAGELLLEPVREVARRSSIAAMRETELSAGVLGERAEVLGAVALVLRESERFVAEPEPLGPTSHWTQTLERDPD
jgi:predicted NBD/HSP70 family sugar kinase